MTRKLSRRKLFWWISGAAALLTSAAGYTQFIEPHWTQIEEISLSIPTLPAHLQGKRLAQISDLHLGPYFSQERLATVIQQINQLAPDWLLITGDYATVKREQQSQLSQFIQQLTEPLRLAKMPIYASLGNHDLWSRRPQEFIAALTAGGATVLRNRNIAVESGLWLAGIDSAWGGKPDLRVALRDLPDRATTLLLAHEPDFIDQVIAHDAPIAAQFSGHSHGGQVRIPLPMPAADGRFSYAPVLPHLSERYPIGLRKIGTRYAYTNRGLGTWPVPYRFNCPPEISIFTLA